MRRAVLGLLVLLLAGCLQAGFEEPPPGGPVETRWAPATAPTAIALTVHGFNDRKAAFTEFGQFAATQGVLVVAYDQAGFGVRSDRRQWAGTPQLVGELHDRVRTLQHEYPGVPVYVVAESMGASVAIVAFSEPEAPAIAGLVLVSPAVWGGNTLKPLYRLILRSVSTIAPGIRVTGRGLGRQSSDNIPAIKALAKDPMFIKDTRLDTIQGVVGLMDEARRRAPEVKPPTMVLIGANDQIVPLTAVESFLAEDAPRDCTTIAYLAGWHLLLRDLQRERVFEDILAWMHGDPPPSGLWRPCTAAATASARH